MVLNFSPQPHSLGRRYQNIIIWTQLVNKQHTTNYNNIQHIAFVTIVDQIYEEMVNWRTNLFLLPTGKKAKDFIKLTTVWLHHYNVGDSFQGLALNVVMILPNLFLQKPSATSKTKEHSKVQAERLQLSKEGKINEILHECKILQKKLKSGKKRTQDDVT